MKLNKLLDLIGLNESNKKSVDDEIDKIIKEKRFNDDNRYNNLYKILGVNKLNRETQREITDKLDETLTKVSIHHQNSKLPNLYEMYYPKKEVNENVKKISKDDFKWVGNHSERLEEMSLAMSAGWMDSNKKVWIDENNVVLFSNTHLTTNGDRLTLQQKEYLNQMGITFILKPTGD